MNQTIRALIGALSISAVLAHAATPVSPTFVPRSQSRDKVRQVVGVTHKTHLDDQDNYYGLFSITPEYTQSFRGNRIAQCLFGSDLIGASDSSCDTTIKIQGTQAPGTRDPKAWLADYFYLAPDFDGTISFNPRIRNCIIDFDLYVGLDPWICGSYLRLYGPVVNSRWDLQFCEKKNDPTLGYTQGYFGPDAIENSKLNQSFGDFARGNAPTVTGLTFNPLRFGKIACDDRHTTGFAELRAELGWNFIEDCDYHFGLNVQAAAPTGTKQHAEYLFDSVVGNGKHWELGGGMTGHYIFWRCDSEDKDFGFYVDANITHLFNTTQQRTFDLKNKPNSRYALAEKLGTPVTNGLDGNVGNPNVATAANAQFQNEYTPVANLTTADVKVGASVQADIVAFFNYTSCNWSFDLGYNFWARSCEKIECPSVCNTGCNATSLFSESQENSWALKGDARVYGFIGGTGIGAGSPVALSATQHDADIHAGTNAAQPTNANDPVYKQNRGVDGAQVAGVNNPSVAFLDITPANANDIFTSIQPIFLSKSDIDTTTTTRGLSHKLFAHVSHTWDRTCWSPYLGVGGFAEFGKNESSSCSTSASCTTPAANLINCNNCTDCSLSQWGLWLKAGLSFN